MPKEEALAMPIALRGLDQARVGGIPPRNLGRSAYLDYGKWPRSLSLMWLWENDPERNPACWSGQDDTQSPPICRALSMRLEAGTESDLKGILERERCLFRPQLFKPLRDTIKHEKPPKGFFGAEEASQPTTSLEYQSFISKDSNIAAWILFNCQRTIILILIL